MKILRSDGGVCNLGQFDTEENRGGNRDGSTKSVGWPASLREREGFSLNTDHITWWCIWGW